MQHIKAPKLAAVANDLCGIAFWSDRQSQHFGESFGVHERAVEEVEPLSKRAL